ncbi:hypothetical protein KIW84_022701 [Lathyrus oleraceus]|uniref:Uncharacterized protein n=1 Tax=Pisum sativum TaxID=3888 RepID=A0A9D4YDR3_PEA|nr:hypothetical protein KIW84_022701 [Pisum sativum]
MHPAMVHFFKPAAEAIPYFEQLGPAVSQMMPIVEANPILSLARSAQGDAWKMMLDIVGLLVKHQLQHRVFDISVTRATLIYLLLDMIKPKPTVCSRSSQQIMQNDAGQLRGRTEIAPDQREKFLQKFQQVQQQGPDTLLNMPSLVAGNHKQFSSQQQSPLLQQFNSQGSSVSSQSSMGLGAQPPSLGGISSVSLQQPNSVHPPSSQQAFPGAAKDADKIEEQQQSSLPVIAKHIKSIFINLQTVVH